jgi:hypothetical protein
MPGSHVTPGAHAPHVPLLQTLPFAHVVPLAAGLARSVSEQDSTPPLQTLLPRSHTLAGGVHVPARTVPIWTETPVSVHVAPAVHPMWQGLLAVHCDAVMHAPLQSAPVVQFGVHTPPTHATLPPVGAAHGVQVGPQLFGSVSAAQLAVAVQKWLPGKQPVHAPLTHWLPPVHALPQAAQLLLVPSGVHTPVQSAWPVTQRGVHTPPTHVTLPPVGCVQSVQLGPQLFGSVSAAQLAVAEQKWLPAAQPLHAPATHMVPPVHARPHVPQLVALVDVSTHAPLQLVVPGAHPQLPP